jgi:hypothetical protein
MPKLYAKPPQLENGRRRHLLLFLAFFPAAAFCGVPLQATLQELAVGADHMLVGRIVGVDMIDSSGSQVTDPEAMTGPDKGTQIRLIVQIDEIVFSNVKTVPPTVRVPLASHLHYSLGQIRAAHAEVSPQLLVFLNGPRFEAIKPGVLLRPLSDKGAALKIRGISR